MFYGPEPWASGSYFTCTGYPGMIWWVKDHRIMHGHSVAFYLVKPIGHKQIHFYPPDMSVIYFTLGIVHRIIYITHRLRASVTLLIRLSI